MMKDDGLNCALRNARFDATRMNEKNSNIRSLD